jgi:hypothetical protein
MIELGLCSDLDLWPLCLCAAVFKAALLSETRDREAERDQRRQRRRERRRERRRREREREREREPPRPKEDVPDESANARRHVASMSSGPGATSPGPPATSSGSAATSPGSGATSSGSARHVGDAPSVAPATRTPRHSPRGMGHVTRRRPNQSQNFAPNKIPLFLFLITAKIPRLPFFFSCFELINRFSPFFLFPN